MSKKLIKIYSIVIVLVGLSAIYYINTNLAIQPGAKISVNQNEAATAGDLGKKADLGFPGIGKVSFIAKKIGDHVSVGEVLAKMESADVAAQYAQAQAGVQIAQGDLAALQDSLRKEKLKLKASGMSSNDKKIQKKQIASVEDSIVSQNARVSQAKDAANQVAAQLDKTSIVAPFDGTITRQDIELGEVVNPNISVLTVSQGS